MLDPSVILAGKLPAPVNFIDALSKVAQLRDTQSQTALRSQQAQEAAGKYQREQQQNAEADRASAAQKMLGEQLAANTTQGPDGSSSIDYGTVAKNLAAAGHGKEATGVLVQQRADEKSKIEDASKQADTAKKQAEMLSNRLQSLSQVPDEQLPAAYDQNLQELTQMGAIKPGTVPPSQQILQQGGPAALRQFVSQHAAAATAANQQVETHQKDLDYALRLNEFQQKTLTERPKTEKEWLDNGSQVLKSATTPQQWQAGIKGLLEGGAPMRVIAQFGDFDPQAPTRAAQLGMSAKEAADVAEKNKPKPGVDVPLPADVQAQKIAIAQQSRPPSEAAQNTLDREAKQYGAAHSKNVDAANSQLEKIADARAMVNGNAEAQALGLPKVLTALVGGQGSGVRITQPELNSIAKARGWVGDIEGTLNSISGNGKLSDTQKKQLTGILDDVKTRLEQKRDLANETLTRINTAKSRDEIVSADTQARNKLAAMEKGGSNVAQPKSKTEYDALLKGAHYVRDGKEYIKN
jgi:hypothetical protein